jgi:hypothetical protein
MTQTTRWHNNQQGKRRGRPWHNKVAVVVVVDVDRVRAGVRARAVVAVVRVVARAVVAVARVVARAVARAIWWQWRLL